MDKILILGGTGMLGNAVYDFFSKNGVYDVTSTFHTNNLLDDPKAVPFDVLFNDVTVLPTGFDYVINCIGVIKPFMAQNLESAIRINSLFPWQLARWCETNGSRLFHITTDCVFSGRKGKYVESDLHDALDEYGKTKSLGECTEKSMVLRTSIIGEEIHKNASLLAWAKSQRGKTVNGFLTHIWNGLTTNWYARIIDKIIQDDLYENGLFHVFAKNDVSKYEMLQFFNEKYHLGLTVEKRRPTPIDRTLRTEKGLCSKLNIPTVQKMIEEL